MFDLSDFLGRNFFGDDGFESMFVYQPAFNTLELGTEYVISWKSKGISSIIYYFLG